ALQPEKANVGTVGFLLEPAVLRGFSAAVGYYNIRVTQIIQNAGAQNVLNGCYFGANDTDCTRIAREPMFGSITNIFDLDQNVATTQTSGLVLSARYSLPTVGGRFGLLFDSTYLIYYRQTQPSGSVISAAGNYDLGSGTAPIGNLTPKVKFNAGLDYALA